VEERAGRLTHEQAEDIYQAKRSPRGQPLTVTLSVDDIKEAIKRGKMELNEGLERLLAAGKIDARQAVDIKEEVENDRVKKLEASARREFNQLRQQLRRLMWENKRLIRAQRARRQANAGGYGAQQGGYGGQQGGYGGNAGQQGGYGQQ